MQPHSLHRLKAGPVLDYRKKQTGTLGISENTTFTNDDVVNYVIGAPLPFNPALLAASFETFTGSVEHTRTGEIPAQIHVRLGVFFSENPESSWTPKS